MPLPFFYHFLHFIHRLLLFYELTTVCRYLSLLSLGGLSPVIHLRFCSCLMYSRIHFILMCRISWTCVRTIGRWPFVIVTACCAIQTLERGSKNCCTVVYMAYLCRALSVPRFILLSFAAKKSSNTRRICRRLWRVLMESRYPKLVHWFSFHVVRLVNSILQYASIFGWVTATSSFVCLIKRRG